MKFDRNTVLGFLVLAALFIGYFVYTSKEQATYRKNKARQDSITNANKPHVDTTAQRIDAIKADSTSNVLKTGHFQSPANDSEQLIRVENDLMRITFTTKGGQPKMVELKKFMGLDSSWVRLASTKNDGISYTILTAPGTTDQTSNLSFNKVDSIKNADGSRSISLTALSSDSSSITHQYTIRPDDYMIDFSASLNRANGLLTNGVMNLTWQYTATQQESSLSYERQNTQVGYVKNGEFDYHSIFKRKNKDFDNTVDWVGIRQRFFFTILVSKNKFAKDSRITWETPAGDTNIVVQSTAQMQVQLPVASSARADFSIYYGPSDYHILKKYGMKFEKLVNLGQGMYSFVRPLNKYVIMPIFDLMAKSMHNYGIAIMVLTIIIRLLISPLTYTSYLSGAKMKVLRPEIAALKAKYGGDQQQMSVEQMKLFREAGVNPLGGCIPALLQIPIFFALFSFFGSEVGLRGASFLWSHDLSGPDKVLQWGHVPVISSILGDHLSLFTVTAVITSFLISLYSMSMTPDQSNPVLKYMPYIFPIFLLFIFNRLPSALTWYYTVSNLITLGLQFVIQNYIIDHNKILAKMEENRKKPKVKSKWQERMEQMQEQQKQLKQQRNKR